MARGALRGAASAWLGLIVLQAVVSKGGSGKVAGAFDAVNSLVSRALDPNVAAIPDYAGGAGAPAMNLGSAPVAGTAAAPTYGNGRATPRVPVPGLNSAT